jgi:hypothetical protein
MTNVKGIARKRSEGPIQISNSQSRTAEHPYRRDAFEHPACEGRGDGAPGSAGPFL